MKKLSKQVMRRVNEMLAARLITIIEVEESELFRTQYADYLNKLIS